jgi:putative RecB family exonuclease
MTATERPVQRTIAELLQSVSASRLSTWQQCRLKFWFRYLSGIVKAKSHALHTGSAVHETLKFWNKSRWRGEAPSLKRLHEEFMAVWSKPEHGLAAWGAGEEAAEQATGWRLLETYFRESPIAPNEKPEAVEVSVEAELKQHGLPKLVGIIDLVRAGQRIVDFKTTGKTPDPEQVVHTTEAQVTGYALLYRAATGSREQGIELHHLVKLKSPKLIVTTLPPATESQMTRLLRGIESYARGLEQEDFVPSPGFGCMSCEFFNECRGWTGGGR